MPDTSFLEHFARGLREPARSELLGSERFAERLLERWRIAQAAAPSVSLAAEVFLPYWAQKVEPGATPSEALGLRVADLYVACACGRGDPAALRVLETSHLPSVDAALRRMGMAAQVQDVKQQLREQLLFSRGHGSPGIYDYAGRGGLRSWLRMMALRTALRLVQRTRGEVRLEASVLEVLAPRVEDVGLQQLKIKYRAEFESAFREAVEALPRRDRALLRRHYLEDLTIDQVGALYRVHRATAARWIAVARGRLLDETRSRLKERLKVSEKELDSIVRTIRSRLEITLRGLLGGP